MVLSEADKILVLLAELQKLQRQYGGHGDPLVRQGYYEACDRLIILHSRLAPEVDRLATTKELLEAYGSID